VYQTASASWRRPRLFFFRDAREARWGIGSGIGQRPPARWLIQGYIRPRWNAGQGMPVRGR
ncbi:MAG: hypothetical protein ACK53L_25925, partial [Pirellulaceae bacterium]